MSELPQSSPSPILRSWQRCLHQGLLRQQSAYLGSLANNIDPIFQIGKASLTPEIIEALDAALEKRELIKVSVLKNCIDDPKEIASVIAERTHSNVVKVIGKKMIFYRKAKKNPKIKLPE
jgi:RNA-binding protein